MSQEKIDQRKKAKIERKTHVTKQHTTSYGAYVGVTLFFLVFLVWIGYSVCLQAGIITIPEQTTTFASQISADDLAKQLASGDPLGCYTTVATENEETTTAAEATTQADDTTAADEAEETTAE